MSKYAFLGLAAILTAAGTAALNYANGTEEPANGSTGEGEEPQKRGRGRPPAGDKAPAGAAAAPDGTQRFEANRVLIKPLIDGNQGEEVKAVIAKYSKTGLKDLPAASQADFEKDIAALTY